MNVSELIEQLKKFDGNTMVVIDGYEGGVNEVEEVEEASVDLDVNAEDYYGAHELSDSGKTPVVYIR